MRAIFLNTPKPGYKPLSGPVFVGPRGYLALLPSQTRPCLFSAA